MARASGEFGELFGTMFVATAVIGGAIILAIIVSPFALAGVAIYFGYRLYRDSPARAERLAREETHLLYNAAVSKSETLAEEEIDRELAQKWPSGLSEQFQDQLLEIGRTLFAAEGLSADVPPPPTLCNTIEGGRYRDMIARLGQGRADRQMSLSALQTISESLAVIANAAPRTQGEVLVPIAHFLQTPGAAVSAVIAPFFAPNDYNHFKALRDRLNQNLNGTHRTAPIFPEDWRGEDVAETYLAGTPLLDLFAIAVPFSIPEPIRFEHTHIIAGSGHGKTQTLQFHIARDLEDVDRGDKSVVVIDSQGDLIRTILKADLVDPGRIVLIDPEDILWPVCLNLFSVGQERLKGYDPVERERLTNSIIELYDFVLGSLLSAGMTQKQSVVFRYVTRLMFHIPNATIHTLRELMEPGGAEAYREQINQLSGTARRFFETEFEGKEFASTKQQVLRRLYGILENQTFERMFSHPQSKLDLFTELNSGKLILINTAKSLLKETGTEIFGRFFIALIAQAAQERATIPDWERLPTMVYIDEAQDYFDRNVAIILAQARKYRVGMVLAHQYLGQLEPKLQEAFEANTSIKMAGGVSARDARALAGQLGCEPDLIQKQPKGSFATFVRGLTDRAIPLSFPFFILEKGPQRSGEEVEGIRQRSREEYAVPLRTDGPAGGADGDPEPSESDPDDDPSGGGSNGSENRDGTESCSNW